MQIIESPRSKEFIRHLHGLSLLKKTVIANSLVVLLGAIAGVYLTRALAERHSGLLLIVVFSTVGSAITILVNYVVFSSHFRPLVELSHALDEIKRGQKAREAIAGVRQSGFSGVLQSVRTLLDLIEDDSLFFSARLLSSIEVERQRISRELHDNTSQVLAATLLRLALLEKSFPREAEAMRASLGDIRDLIGNALDQLKSVVYDLRPAMLDDLGLVPALNWYLKKCVERPGVEVSLTCEGTKARLPHQVEIALFRVAQEALANAVKHADARRIEVIIELQPGFVALKIFDNGRGFDLHQARGRGLGLLSMRERIGLFDGQFNIVTAPGRGTRVYAVVPLDGLEATPKEEGA